MHPREPGAFVVGRAPRPYAVAFEARRKIDGRIGSHACRIRRDVVVIEEEDLPLSGTREASPDHRVRAFTRDDLNGEADAFELAAQPPCTTRHAGIVSAPGRDATVVDELVEEARQVGIDESRRCPPLSRRGHLSSHTYLIGMRWFTNENRKPFTYG